MKLPSYLHKNSRTASPRNSSCSLFLILFSPSVTLPASSLSTEDTSLARPLCEVVLEDMAGSGLLRPQLEAVFFTWLSVVPEVVVNEECVRAHCREGG